MSSYNKVILMGNLTRDPELRYTQSNVPICKFGLAVNRRFKDSQSGEWREEPTFVDITMFGRRGEAFAKYHQKGKPAFVEGELRFDTWEDQSGNKRSKLYVVAEEWQFVGGGSGRSEGYSDSGPSHSAPSQGAPSHGAASQGTPSQGTPSQGTPGQGGGQEPQPGGYGEPRPEYLEVDDTPF